MAVEYVTTDFRPETIAHDFAEANEFTEVDLLTNRTNKISNSQMLRLAIQALVATLTEEETQGLDKFHGEKKWSYRYAVKDLELEVTENGYELLHREYDRTRPKVKIYYTPKTQMLLSIEPI